MGFIANKPFSEVRKLATGECVFGQSIVTLCYLSSLANKSGTKLFHLLVLLDPSIDGWMNDWQREKEKRIGRDIVLGINLHTMYARRSITELRACKLHTIHSGHRMHGGGGGGRLRKYSNSKKRRDRFLFDPILTTASVPGEMYNNGHVLPLHRKKTCPVLCALSMEKFHLLLEIHLRWLPLFISNNVFSSFSGTDDSAEEDSSQNWERRSRCE